MMGFKKDWKSLIAKGRKLLGMSVKRDLSELTQTVDTSMAKRRQIQRYGKPRHGYPKCEPGTIAYHDKLVRHFGRRMADWYGECIQRKKLELLPTKRDFANNPPWAWRSA